MLVTRKQKRNMRKDLALAGLEVVQPLVAAAARPIAEWSLGQMERAIQGIASAFKSNGNTREEIAKVVAPLAQSLRMGSKAPKFTSTKGVVRIDAFRPAEDFKSNMDLWLNRFRSAKPIQGQEKVYVAGDIERNIS